MRPEILFTFSIFASSLALRLAYDADQMEEIEKIFGVQPVTDSEKRERLIRFLQQPLSEVQKNKLLNVWKHADMMSSGRGKREIAIEPSETEETVGDVFAAVWKALRKDL